MFKFLKRLRGKDVDTSVPEQENQPAAIIEVLPELDLPAMDVASVEHVPLFACSLSIDSKSALKFPAPNPRAPIL